MRTVVPQVGRIEINAQVQATGFYAAAIVRLSTIGRDWKEIPHEGIRGELRSLLKEPSSPSSKRYCELAVTYVNAESDTLAERWYFGPQDFLVMLVDLVGLIEGQSIPLTGNLKQFLLEHAP